MYHTRICDFWHLMKPNFGFSFYVLIKIRVIISRLLVSFFYCSRFLSFFIKLEKSESMK